MSDEMCMFKRTAEHDRLNYLVGEWKTRETHHPSPWLPNGGTGEGRCTTRWGVGNLCLLTDYRSKGPSGSAFEGHAVDTWDPVKKVYQSWWFDNMAPTGMRMAGRYEGDDLVSHAEIETPKGTMRMRMISHPISASSYVAKMDMEIEGKWVPTMEITYVRA